ncbi:MAG: PKD domain-containing protein [Natronomonas sp.]
MRFHLLLVATLVVLCSAVGGSVATEEPMADAGLDQTVTDGTPVELDGSGSLHPDGQITSYEWSIDAEGQGTFEPDCSNCERTEFVPPGQGTYRVTLTVTDATGRSATDSMSLTVTRAGPSVELTNASEIQTDRPVTLASEIESRNAKLDRIGWALNGTLLVERSLSGSTDRSELQMTFDVEKAYRIQVVAIDTHGRSTYQERVVQTADADESNLDRKPQLSSLPQPEFGTEIDRSGSITNPNAGIGSHGHRPVPESPENRQTRFE